ncbi:MAG: prepilin-type N-terminal cleavage/methylation domain-containing protein [Phycisphaeraceae bacterium]|nr:MAG: prepilin-type N-terminal cleavage/methylation domain-containing protein [Phycisphaeraceae bacterium]
MKAATTVRAFTLTELLVVIAILVILVLVGLPAFASVLYASNRTVAENALRAGMSAARDAAVRNRVESAAVFFYEPGGRTIIVPCVRVGSVLDVDGAGASVERSVFAPVGVIEPQQLPRGWMVRGYAPSGTLHSNTNRNYWYEPRPGRVHDATEGSWVFPETGFYGVDGGTANDGNNRQTFMVRFEAGTGNVIVSDFGPAVVVSPRPSAVGRVALNRGVNAWQRPDVAENVSLWASRFLARPSGAVPGGVTDIQRRQIIGNESADTVLAGAVSLIALYDEQKLASALGARGLNRVSGSLYLMPDETPPNRVGGSPDLDPQLFPGGLNAANVGRDIDLWLTGQLQRGGRFVESDTVLLVFDTFTGQPREVKP